MIELTDWGRLPSGETVRLATLRDGHGLECRIASYGATLTTIRTPDRDGRIDDVLLGFDTLDGYLAPAFRAARPFMGSTVGRYANRIADARFVIDGIPHILVPNEGTNQLHGGPQGFDRQLWSMDALATGDGVRLALVSPVGDQGFPGTLHVEVEVRIGTPGEILLDYRATTDAPTHVNLASHGYFNLAGRASRSIGEHRLAIAADHVVGIDDAAIPAEAPFAVAGTPFDFRHPTRVGAALAGEHPQLSAGDGFDHCFVLADRAEGAVAAVLTDPASGRRLEVITSEPGLQLYTANAFDGSLADGQGRPFVRRQALCLETQHFPDSPNRPDFPSTLLRPGDVYRSETRLRFGIA